MFATQTKHHYCSAKKNLKQTNFVYDINGYNCISLDQIKQTGGGLTLLMKNLRFRKRKINYSSTTRIDGLELCL